MSSSKQAKNVSCAYDMVRLGIDLYEIDDGISLSGEILEIKELRTHEKLGYSHTFTAHSDTTIACVNIGYGDIAVRKLSNNGQVIINGKKCNIIGNVCMDCLFADISGVDAKIGDTAILFGKQEESSISICEVAASCDTISYELFTSISERVKRIYK